VDDREIERIVNHWQSQSGIEDLEQGIPPWENLVDSQSGDRDNLIDEAIQLVQKDGYASTSRLQRYLRIGFPRAARLMDELENLGVVGPQESGGRVRKVINNEDYSDIIEDES